MPLLQRPQGEISALITLLKTAAIMSERFSVCVCACTHARVTVCVTGQYKITFGTGGFLSVFLFIDLRETIINWTISSEK